MATTDPDVRDVDYVITTAELAKIIKDKGIDLVGGATHTPSIAIITKVLIITNVRVVVATCLLPIPAW